MLTRDCLYVANEGKSLSSDGIISLMASHLSRKRGDEIGRFGLGFKSVVAISDRPQIFSRSVSIGFDREHARARIAEIVPEGPYPMLRVAEPLDPHRIADEDPVLAELMTWATTVVRVPLLKGYDDLATDVRDFPAEFLLFSPHANGAEARGPTGRRPAGHSRHTSRWWSAHPGRRRDSLVRGG